MLGTMTLPRRTGNHNVSEPEDLWFPEQTCDWTQITSTEATQFTSHVLAAPLEQVFRKLLLTP